MFFARNRRDRDIELDNIVIFIPECWWYDVRLKNLCDGFVVCKYDHRFRGSPKNVPEFLKSKSYCREFFRMEGHLQLGRTKCLGSISYWCKKSFLVDVYFSRGSSSMRTAYPVAEKLASVMRAFCFFGRGCLSASSQHRSRALLISVNFSTKSGVTRTFMFLVNSLKNGVSFSESLGIYLR